MKISVPIEIDAVLDQLPIKEKIRLVRRLEKETWASQLDEVVTHIRARPAVRLLSPRGVDRIVEEARKARSVRAARRP